MSKTTWGDVRKGNVVELRGRDWTVAKIKRDGKKAVIKLERRGREAKGVVKLKDPVTIVSVKVAASKRGPLFDATGTAQRWATREEAEEAMRATSLPAGNPEITEPPKKVAGSPWATQADRIEESLDRLLQAHLVGESKNESAGYYVPPVDASTIASHLVFFHGGVPDGCDDETKMLRAHDAQHAAAFKREGALDVNHWHTKTRP